MIDRPEAIRRGQSRPQKTITKHPYAAIEHRVIDSAAYADLTFAARSLLVLLARQLTKDNNGMLQATYSYLRRFGFDSEHTISRCLKQLISNGFIYRTRAGGYQNGAALYAVTWLPIKKRDGLHLDGFKACAWRDWQPCEKKSPPSKVQDTHCKNGISDPITTPKNAVGCPSKNADYELMPCSGAISGTKRNPTASTKTRSQYQSPWLILRRPMVGCISVRAIH